MVTADTIRSWLKRVDEQGPNALVQLREPVNKFPDFVRYLVQQLKALCPMLGKVKIAQILARAGLHLGATTVGRMLKEKPIPKPTEDQKKDGKNACRHLQVPESSLADRFDDGSHRSWVLDDVAALFSAAVLAVRLVDWRRHGSLLAADHGHHAFRARADVGGDACLPGPRDPHGRSKAQASGQRPRAPVLLRWLQAVVPAEGNQARGLVPSASTAASP